MPASTLTSKGQITIPAEVRRTLGLKSGSRVEFVPMDNGSYELVPANGTVAALKGLVPAPPTPVTLQEMDEAVGGAAAEAGLA